MTTGASRPSSVRATLSAASIDVFGLFGRVLQHISTVSDPKGLEVGSIPVIGLLIVEAALEGVEIEISAAVLDADVL